MATGLSIILKLVRVSGLIVLACLSFATEAIPFDVHTMFESRCGRCHEHAGDLAREKLVIADGRLRGRTSGNDIRNFLPGHYGNPDQMETAALYELLLWQVKAGGKFKTRCAICHVRARELGRLKLVLDGPVLRGRYSGRDMSEFLVTHGRIQAAEVDFFLQLLKRMAPTIDR
jgi:hypothetical protein